MPQTLSLALIAMLATLACRRPTTEGTGPDAEPASLTEESLPVTRLRPEPYSFAYSSGYRDSARIAVRDAVQWRAAWTRLHGNQGESPPLPAVDFSREMLIVAAMGTRATGGFSIFIDSAYRREDGVEIVVRRVSPGRTCGVTAALSQPVDIARIPALSGTVVFTERREMQDCP